MVFWEEFKLWSFGFANGDIKVPDKVEKKFNKFIELYIVDKSNENLFQITEKSGRSSSTGMSIKYAPHEISFKKCNGEVKVRFLFIALIFKRI